jgi:signal transduction histidine kinase/ActR/RegA family two-component response regulator
MASELFSPAEVAHGLQILASVLDGQSFREELAMPTVGRWFDSTTWAMSQDRYVVMIEDISMRRRLEEEVFRTQKLDSVGLLAGGIAHDFNNILTGIVGNISLVRLEAGLDTRAHSMLESAESACGRARDLTQQLLTFSRGGDPVKADASLPDVLRQAADFVMAGSNVSCTYRFAASGLAVAIDRGQISQVVQNLVLNALQAMPDGGSLEIGADRVDLSEGSVLPLRAGTWVRFWVRDHGDGIDAKHLGKIFDPYFTTKKTGVGLGLPVAFSIVRKHGGSITVDSAVGRGSDFTVYLPTSPEPAVSDVDKVPSGIISRRRVLLMDDDSMVREVIGRMLVSLGYEASSVPDGREAVRLFKHHMQQGVPFDVVLMDLTVPGGMGGKAAMKEILALDPSARSIVMSGYCMDSVMANHHAHGFLGVLQKPVRMSDLQSALERVLALPPG